MSPKTKPTNTAQRHPLAVPPVETRTQPLLTAQLPHLHSIHTLGKPLHARECLANENPNIGGVFGNGKEDKHLDAFQVGPSRSKIDQNSNPDLPCLHGGNEDSCKHQKHNAPCQNMPCVELVAKCFGLWEASKEGPCACAHCVSCVICFVPAVKTREQICLHGIYTLGAMSKHRDSTFLSKTTLKALHCILSRYISFIVYACNCLYCVALRCIAWQLFTLHMTRLPPLASNAPRLSSCPCPQCLRLQGTIVHKSHTHLLATPPLPPQQRKRCASKTSRQQQCRPSVTQHTWSHSSEIDGTRHKFTTRGFQNGEQVRQQVLWSE